MSKNLVPLTYDGQTVMFTDDGWFDATGAAERFGKRPNDWLNLDETKEYMDALRRGLNTGQNGILNHRFSGDLVRTRRGKNGGTWLHPKLAVSFARWLDVGFAVWCDLQIDSLIRGTHQAFDWRRQRSIAASSYKVLGEIIKETREAEGKPVHRHLFSNEAKLLNSFITGKFEGVNRDELTADELDLLGRLEAADAVFIGRGLDYSTRKRKLEQIAADWRSHRQIAA